jgi:hypothetical protein
MIRTLILIDFLILASFFANGQENCDRKPKKLEHFPFNSDNKLITDRFYHTISPDIIKYKHIQLETALFLRNQFYENDNITSTTTNIYSSYKIRYAFPGKLEMYLSLNEIIIFSGEEIKVYGGVNPYSRISFGAKYLIYKSTNRKNNFGFTGQIALPKFQQAINSSFSYEARILYSIKPARSLCLTGNFGAAYIDKENKMLTYAFEMKFFITRKLELLSEFYRNYIDLSYAAYPQNRILLGNGYFLSEKTYIYLTYENGAGNNNSLNKGRIDVGLTCRF